jgi:hypothetical protein
VWFNGSASTMCKGRFQGVKTSWACWMCCRNGVYIWRAPGGSHKGCLQLTGPDSKAVDVEAPLWAHRMPLMSSQLLSLDVSPSSTCVSWAFRMRTVCFCATLGGAAAVDLVLVVSGEASH